MGGGWDLRMGVRVNRRGFPINGFGLGVNVVVGVRVKRWGFGLRFRVKGEDKCKDQVL